MFKHLKIRLALSSIALITLPTFADMNTMGTDYRQMISNYFMLAEIKSRCPNISQPEIVTRSQVDRLLQQKMGMENFFSIREALDKSPLHKNSVNTVAKLFEKIEGCDDPRLNASTNKITEVHQAAFKRFEKEPGMIQPTPIPLRKNNQ